MDERTSRAIAHLAEALYLLSCVRDQGDQPTVPVTIGENRIMVTPKTAEALADAVDSMNAYMASEDAFDDKLRAAVQQVETVVDVDKDSLNRSNAELMARIEAMSSEAIESGEWSAAAVAQNDTDLWDSVNKIFDELDLRVLTKKVLDDATADNLTVNQALDSFFAEIADPYADEDEG